MADLLLGFFFGGSEEDSETSDSEPSYHGNLSIDSQHGYHGYHGYSKVVWYLLTRFLFSQSLFLSPNLYFFPAEVNAEMPFAKRHKGLRIRHFFCVY